MMQPSATTGQTPITTPSRTLAETELFHEDKVPRREVRLAVTMVGGTSLAVYECGVAQELFRMVHGTGLYGLLKRLTHSDAYIDILSGTSAGGINAICLSAALTNGTDFSVLRDVWISLAGVDSLLQDPLNRNVRALFKGDSYYLETLENAFDKLTDGSKAPYREGGVGSFAPEGRDLDLFVTGTYYDGQPRAFFDTRNQPIFTYDYGGIFTLKHRGSRGESHFLYTYEEPIDRLQASAGSRELYDPEDPEARREPVYKRLARVARTTSSLPAVFEPSVLRPNEMNGIIELPEDLPESYVLDGGFLNNKPIDLVLAEIYRRPADAEVLRKVVFVEPQPEGFRAPSTQQPPNALESVLFYKDVPGRQSLSASLQSVGDHNLRSRRVLEMLEAIRRMLGTSVTPAPQQYNLWVDTCLRDLRNQLVGAWEKALGLEGFGGLQRGGRLSQEQEDERRGRADTLRVLRTRLYEHMRQGCRDFVYVQVPPEDAEGPGPAPGPPRLVYSNPRWQFRLDDINTSFLRRKITNAVQEVYAALYPTPERASGGVPQSRSQNVFESMGHGGYAEVKEQLKVLYRLRDLVEVLERNVGLVVATVARSGPYRIAAEAIEAGAAAEAIEEKVTTLWRLLVGCLRTLLKPEDPAFGALLGECARGLAGPDAEYGPAADKLKDAFGDLSDGMCKALERTAGVADPAGEPVLAAWIAKGQAPNPEEQLLVALIDEQIDAAVYRAGRALEPALRDAARHADPTKHGGPPLPLTWVLGEAEGTMQEVAEIKRRLQFLDVYLFPVEEAAGLPSRNQIEVVHVSPRDVQSELSAKDPRYKVAGDVLANLGGFFKRSWRANDILWGRLDGVGAIIDTLLDRERLRRLLKADPDSREDALGAVRGYVLRGDFLAGRQQDPPEPDGIGRMLQGDYLALEARLRDRFDREARGEYVEALMPEDVAALRSLLLRRCHYEIVGQEVPVVIAEAVAEHAVWQGGGEADPLRLRRRDEENERAIPDTVADAAIVKAAEMARVSGYNADGTVRQSIQEAARRWARGLFPGGAEQALPYFRRDYAIGQETLQRDIPPVVTLHRLVGGLLVVLHVLDSTMSAGFKSGPVGRLLTGVLLRPLSVVIGALYGFVTLLAQNSAAAAALHAALWSIIVLGVMLAFFGATRALLPLAGLALLCEIVYWWVRRSARRLAAAPPGMWELQIVLFGLLAVLAYLAISLVALAGAPNPLDWIGVPRGGPLAWIIGAALIIAVRVVSRRLTALGAPLQTGLAPQGIVSLELAGSAEEVNHILASWDARDVGGSEPGEARSTARKSLQLDFLFIPVYVATLAFFCLLAARGAPASSWWAAAGICLATLQIAAGLLDVIENVVLLRMIGGKVSEGAARLAQLCARVKFGLIFLGLAYVLAGAGIALAQTLPGWLRGLRRGMS